MFELFHRKQIRLSFAKRLLLFQENFTDKKIRYFRNSQNYSL